MFRPSLQRNTSIFLTIITGLFSWFAFHILSFCIHKPYKHCVLDTCWIENTFLVTGLHEGLAFFHGVLRAHHWLFYNGVAKLIHGQDHVENFGVSVFEYPWIFLIPFTNITRWQLINL